jgi:hypothetical protein
MKLEQPTAPVAAADVPLGRGPSVLPPTQLPKNIHPGFVIGESDRIHDTRIVAYAIMCRADYKVGDREFSGSSLGLHETVLMKRFYEENNGSVRLDPTWPPGLRRLVPMTQEMLQKELERFKVTFIVPRQQGALELTPLFLGVEPAEQIRRLHDVMRRQMEAWAKVLETAKGRIPEDQKRDVHPEIVMSMACDHITQRELEEIANMADPSRDGLKEVTLDEIVLPGATAAIPLTEAAPAKTLDELQAQAAKEVDAQTSDPLQVLIERLMAEASVTDGQAMQIASLVDLAGGAAKVADDDIIGVLGTKAKLAGVKRVLKG